MESKILESRRKVHPLESEPGVLLGWLLSFNFRQLPWMEPSTGTLEEYPSSSGSTGSEVAACHGVCHKLTRKDMLKIMVTESCNGHLDVDCYTLRRVTVQSYSGRPLQACIFVHIGANVSFPSTKLWHPSLTSINPGAATPSNNHSSSGSGRGRAAAVAPPFHACSKRYLKLLQVGARENNLDPKVLRFLDALPTYTPHAMGRLVVGVYAVMAFTVLALPMLLLYVVHGGVKKKFRSSWHFQRMLLWFLKGAWVIHDILLELGLVLGRSDTAAWETYMQECGGVATDSKGNLLAYKL